MRYPATALPGLLVICLQLGSLPASAHTPAEEMSAAAKNFVAALTPEQRAQAVFEFKDEQRFDWHFIPKARKGLPFKQMTSPQRALAQALLGSGLSQRGFAKAATIISLEQILYELESKAPTRDSDLYFVSIFGQPGTGAWAWRVEGHHLSLNFAIAGDQVLAVTPSFFGANPAEIKSGPRKGLRTLGDEEDLARKLIQSLGHEQRAVAIFTTNAPREIITGNSRKANALQPEGISAAKLNPAQKEILLELVKEYLFRYRREIAREEFQRIKQGGDDRIHFAWAGGLEPGQGHYYRLQGDNFLVEYDNTQNDANHIHTVWRNLENDFGEDLLRKHYEQVPHR